MVHGGELLGTVMVDGLNGRTAYILAFPDEGEGYYLTADGPLAVVDGTWEFYSPETGDASDIGHNITFLAFAADPTCDAFLRATPDDGEGNVFRPTLDLSCGGPIGYTTIPVT